jgi:rhamnose transport system permease protein
MNNAAIKAAGQGIWIKKILGSWEMVLVFLFVIINVILMVTRTYMYFKPGTLQAIARSSLDISFMALGMIFVLMLGDIDVSIAATMITSAMTIGLVYQSTSNSVLAIGCGLAAGITCGLLNGVLVAFVNMPAVIVTIATSMLYRGIVQIIVGTNSLKVFPKWTSVLAWDSIAQVPVIFWCFIIATVIFGLILHKTKFGRQIFLIGNNRETARYSGIPVRWIRLLVFIIMGLMCAVSSIFFIGRFDGISPTMATGYELDTIAIVVLGGISPSGGKGRIAGPFIAALVMEFLIYTLGLFGVEAITRKIITGIVLIAAVMIPTIRAKISLRFRIKTSVITR